MESYLGPITDSYSVRENPWPREIKEEIKNIGWAAEIYDADWRLRWVSPELRFIFENPTESELGFGGVITEVYQMPIWRSKVTEESYIKALQDTLSYIIYENNSKDAIIASLPEGIKEQLQDTKEKKAPDLWSFYLDFTQNNLPANRVSCLNIKFTEDGRCGWIRLYGPGMKASVLSLVARGSEDMYERMSKLIHPGRRPAAILFCDLAGSTDLARRLPSALYFRLLSAVAKRIDDIIIRHSGLVGKHAGDGASAYFLQNDHNGISAVIRAAIVSAREIQIETKAIANEILKQAGIKGINISIKCALHWGSTLYIGQIVSGGRLEVSALGDEVNECARLESATEGGETLASKALLERLDSEDASDLAIPIDSLIYRPLNEFAGIDPKAIRDTGNISVCKIS
jgi:class 3 adenylate cyclase